LKAGFVLYPDGSSATLILPNSVDTVPTAISDSGVLAGTVTRHAPAPAPYNAHGFVATPITPASQPAIRSVGAVITATAFGGGDKVAPGSWIEIYGQNLSATTRAWQSSDFTGSTAPTSLDGVSVKINGLSAYVYYISPGQVNALIPDSLADGTGASDCVERLTVHSVGLRYRERNGWGDPLVAAFRGALGDCAVLRWRHVCIGPRNEFVGPIPRCEGGRRHHNLRCRPRSRNPGRACRANCIAAQ
jgi:hypothetical protein